MKNFINKLAGDNATPTKRAVVLAALITAAALVVCGITLAVSSVIFAIKDRNSDIPFDTDTPADSGEPAPTVTLEYTTVTKDEMDGWLDKQVSGKTLADRTIEGNNIYYAYKNPSEIKLSSGALNAAHNMLVDFVKNNKALKTDKSNETECNVPLVGDVTNNGATFKLTIYSKENTSIYNNQTYSWLYTNAYKYGFVYSENTFTYVGPIAASYAKSNGSSALTALAAPASLTVNGVKYQVYYISANAAEYKLPTEYTNFEVFSLDGGYIVSVNLSKRISAN